MFVQPALLALASLGLGLPADLAPGAYTMRLGLYDRDTLERVALEAGGDFVVVAEIEVR